MQNLAKADGPSVSSARQQATISAEPKSNDEAAAPSRRPQVDGLRVIAMLGVLYVHLWNNHPLTEHVRVSLFFVVSGFLITHILERAKASGRPVHVLNFYIRRALRLFPALILMVSVAYVFNADNIRNSFWWHALQLSNIYFSINESFAPWVTAHLWSLNMLEQFYVVAPLTILLLPRAGSYLVLIGMLTISVFIRVNWSQFGISGWWPNLALSLDPIASGALAYLMSRNSEIAKVMRSRWALAISIAILVSPWYLWSGFGASESYRLMVQPALACIVVGAFHGYRGLLGSLLASGPARFLSKISYGVYIYHMMVWWLLAEMMPDLYKKGPVSFLVVSAATFIVATISWYAFEQPIARLKSRFPTTGPGNSRRDTAANMNMPAQGSVLG